MHAPLKQPPPAQPKRERSRARRERRSTAARQPVVHIALPGYEIARVEPRPRETITALLRRTGWAKRDREYGWQFRNGLPTICQVNGQDVLRRDWARTRITTSAEVRFISRPLGGGNQGSKQVIGLVALIAVSAFAAWAGPALAAGLGLTGTTATIVGGIATGVIGGIGALAIGTFLRPKPGATNDPNAKTDQIYTVQAQGNVARLGEPLPIGYGRIKEFPDLAAQPWSEFVANDQYLNVLLCVGMGRYEYEQLFVDDTPLWDPVNGVSDAFPSVQIEFYDPGEDVTLFPINVANSVEVTGQQLPDGSPGDWLGGFVVNPSGTLARSIAVDFVFPAGCFSLDGDNNFQNASVTLRAEYRTVNAAGAPTGSWTQLFEETRTYNTRSPIRDTIKTDVAEARYEVRFRRETEELVPNKAGEPPTGTGQNAVVWAGLRAFLAGDSSFDDVSTIALRIKATESTQGGLRFGVLRTRILPVWNGSEFVDEATRNPGWAFLDAISNSVYGPGFPPSKTDFNAIVNFAGGCAFRGDSFDYTFKSAMSVPEALDKILAVGRAKHFWLGDVISIVRDEWRDVPSMLLTDREIVRGSTQINWTMLGEEDPDAVVLEYVDEETWRPAEVQYPPNSESFTAVNPETKRLDGVLNRDHAFREAAFYYLQSIYRRETVQIGTEYEGRALTLGSTIRVQSELPMAFGQAGAAVEFGSGTIVMDPAPDWSAAGSKFIRIRRADGKWFGPIGATKGATDADLILNGSDVTAAEGAQGIDYDDVIAREDGGEFPTIEFGSADNQSRVCKLLSGQPNGDQCTLNLVIDDVRVHATDLGSPPILETSPYPVDQRAPAISFLAANFRQGVAEPILDASWFPASGAQYYIADISYDGGTSWQNIYEGRDTQFSKVVDRAALKVRVQGVGVRRGAYRMTDVDAPTIELIPGIVPLPSLLPELRYQVTTQLEGNLDYIRNFLNKLASEVAKVGSRSTLNTNSVRSQLDSRYQDASARITETRTVATGVGIALAETEIELQAKIDDAEADITETRRVIVEGTGSGNYTALAEWRQGLDLDIDGLHGSITTHATALYGNGITDFGLTGDVGDLQGDVGAIQGRMALAYGVTLDANGYVSGFQVINGGADGSAAFYILADKFVIAQPGVSGGTAVPVFGIDAVSGSAKLALRGDMLADGTITARTVAADAIVANNIAAGAITSGKIAAGAITANKISAHEIEAEHITLGGLPFTSLAAGLTAQSRFTHGVVSAGLNAQVVTSGSFSVDGGVVSITWSATHNYSGLATTNPQPILGFSLVVDGSVWRTWEWNANYGDVWQLKAPFTVSEMVTGLSDGNHTFEIKQAGSTYTYGSNVENGVLIVQNIKR